MEFPPLMRHQSRTEDGVLCVPQVSVGLFVVIPKREGASVAGAKPGNQGVQNDLCKASFFIICLYNPNYSQ